MRKRSIIYRKRLFLNVSIAFFSALAFTSCYYDKEELLYPGSTAAVDCSTVPATFSTEVLPLFTTRCALSGCHNAASASGGLVLDSYTQANAKKDRINIRAVVEKSMPPTGPLAPAEAAKIKCWIDGGALNN